MTDFLTLNRSGIIASVAVGVLLLLFGGLSLGPFFLGVMLWFLFLSGAVTWIGKSRKKAIGVYQRYRNWKNVAANGIIPVLIVVLYHFSSAGQIMPVSFIIVSYVASVAAITADKFSSELGVLTGRPSELMTMRKVRQGTSGAVTVAGIAAGLLGSLFIGVTILAVLPILPQANYGILLVVVVIAGFVGNLVDSVFGHFEERGIGNKFTTNFACSFAGWAAGLLLLLIL
ncbi:MAG: DUF92 domain-containing protein [Candidatus Micrarchaeales archaeon]